VVLPQIQLVHEGKIYENIPVAACASEGAVADLSDESFFCTFEWPGVGIGADCFSLRISTLRIATSLRATISS